MQTPLRIKRTNTGGLLLEAFRTPAISLSDDYRDIHRIAMELRTTLEGINPNTGYLARFSDDRLVDTGLISLDKYAEATDLAYLIPVFRGCWEFFSTGDRDTLLHAELALVLSVWQWNCACKRHLQAMQKHGGFDATEENVYIDELARANAALTRVLWDARYVRIIRLLVGRLMTISRDDALSDSMRREMLMLSSLLVSRTPMDEPIGQGKAFSPFDARGSLLPSWDQIQLLYLFRDDKGGRAAVRRLIVETLLPRYNFIDALHLARESRRPVNPPAENMWWKLLPPLILFTLFGLALMIGGTAFLPVMNTQASGFWLVVILQNLFGLLVPLGWLVYMLDWRVLPNFTLPRVIGGVSIGFLTIALQGESAIKVANAIWTRGAVLVPLLILAVLAVGFAYLFFDALPLTGDYWRAAGRAGMALSATTSIAVMGGLLVSAVTTAAYWSDLVDVGWMSQFLLGPFGWFSAGQFLVFTPVALLTGLLTQFIFEELTLPASVWSQEE